MRITLDLDRVTPDTIRPMEATTIHVGTVSTGAKSCVLVHVRQDSTGAVTVLLTADDGRGKTTETVQLSSAHFGELLALLARAQQRATQLTLVR